MANISAIKLPNGTTYNIVDKTSGYTKNTGTITQVKTTAGAHTTIDVSSGAATFNVPTKTSHLTNDSNFLTSSSSLNAANLSGQIPNIVISTSGIATTDYVTTAIANLPEPMLFKGSVGTGGTVTSLPTAAASNEGWTYKVITALSSPAAKVGDTVISNGSSWVVIPSGDEPSGTVTSVDVSNATNGGLTVSGNPITSSGTITIGHSNVLTSAQTTQAVYPIKIDKNGHISAYGSAVTISTNWLNGSATGSVRTISSMEEDSSYTIGQYAVAEGAGTKASGIYSHAEGASTIASGGYSHAEGAGTTASGEFSHAEGVGTTASGYASHAEGGQTTASGYHSHAEGYYTIANHNSQHVFGQYNIADPSDASANVRGTYIEIVGNGTVFSTRSNARTLDWSGNEVLAGKLTVGAVGTNSMDVATVGQIPTVPSNIVNTITTTAGTHTAITSQKGNVSFNVPTNTSHLTNDSGFITSYTDEKLKIEAVSNNTYYPIVGANSTAASIRQYDSTGFSYSVVNGTTSSTGCSTLILGNNIAQGNANNKEGRIKLYSPKSGYAELYMKNTSTSQRLICFPDKGGTIALTSDIPTVPSSTGSATTGITASTTATKTTLGTAFTIPNVTSAGSASSWTFEEKTIPNVTAAGSGSASLTFTMDTTDTKKLKITFSHTHTAPTIGTAIKVQSKSGGSNGTAPTLGTAFTVPNVTGNTSATVSITDNGHTHTI